MVEVTGMKVLVWDCCIYSILITCLNSIYLRASYGDCAVNLSAHCVAMGADNSKFDELFEKQSKCATGDGG